MNSKAKCLALFAVVGIASFLLTDAVLAEQYAAADSKKNRNSKSVGSNNNDNNNSGKNNGARVVIHGGNLGTESVW